MKNILFVILALFSINAANAKQCVPAFDFGQGSYFYIPANPDEKTSSGTNLILSRPANAQVAPWVPTTFKTLGNAKNAEGTNENVSTLRIYITGQWGPWGGDVSQMSNNCIVRECRPNMHTDAPCLANGLVVPVLENDLQLNLPCKLDKGLGLYGLIAVEHNGITENPNDIKYARQLPGHLFRTFRVYNLQEDAAGNFFEIHQTESCIVGPNGISSCVVDTDENGHPVVARGSLYFKILDSYYLDNTGGYNINLVSGLQAKQGFIDSTVAVFKKQMRDISNRLYNALVKQSAFINIAKAMLVFYVAISGLMFSLGMLNISAADLVIRLFKVSLISILISDSSWDFFNTYLFSFFTDGAQSISELIIDEIFQYSSSHGMGRYKMLPEYSTPLAVFDVIINLIYSSAVWKKIISLMFFHWYICYLIIIVACICLMTFAIIRSISIYITSVMLITMLLFLAPIFFLMLLFSLTKELFDGWLKQLLVNALALIVITISASILVNLILEQFESILTYQVCWQTIYTIDFSIAKWDIDFWYPSDRNQVDNAMNVGNIFSLVFICVLFEAYMNTVPTLIDSLASAGLMPISTLYSSAVSSFQNTRLYRVGSSVVNQGRAMVSIPGLISLNDKGEAAMSLISQKYNGLTGKFEEHMGAYQARHSSDFLSTPRDMIGGAIDKVKNSVTMK